MTVFWANDKTIAKQVFTNLGRDNLHKEMNTRQTIMVLAHRIILCVYMCAFVKLDIKIARLLVSRKFLCISHNVYFSFF